MVRGRVLVSAMVRVRVEGCIQYTLSSHAALGLYTRYPIVTRALGLAAFRPSASREQRYLAYNAWPAFRPSASREQRLFCI